MAWFTPVSERNPTRAINLDKVTNEVTAGADRQADTIDAGYSQKQEISLAASRTGGMPEAEPAEFAVNDQTGEVILANGEKLQMNAPTMVRLASAKMKDGSPLAKMAAAPKGFRLVGQKELERSIAAIPTDSDFWGSLMSSTKTGLGLMASTVDAQFGSDDPSNEWSKSKEAHADSQTVAQYKAAEGNWFSGYDEFITGLGDSLGNVASSVIGAAPALIAGAAVGSSAGPAGTVAGAIGTTGLALSGGMQAYGEQATDFYEGAVEQLSSMTPEQLRAESPLYGEVADTNPEMTHEEVVREVAIRGSRNAGLASSWLGAAEMVVGGRLAKNFIGKLGFGKVARASGSVAAVERSLAKKTGAFFGRGAAYGTAAGAEEMTETGMGQAAGAATTGVGSTNPFDHMTLKEGVKASQMGFIAGALGGGKARTGAANDAAVEDAVNGGTADMGAAMGAAGEQSPNGSSAWSTPQETAAAESGVPAYARGYGDVQQGSTPAPAPELQQDPSLPAYMRRETSMNVPGASQDVQRALPLPGQPGENTNAAGPQPGMTTAPARALAQAVQAGDMAAIDQLLDEGITDDPNTVEVAARMLGLSPEQLGEAVSALQNGATAQQAPGEMQGPSDQREMFVDSQPTDGGVPNLNERRAFQDVQQQEQAAASEQAPLQLEGPYAAPQADEADFAPSPAPVALPSRRAVQQNRIAERQAESEANPQALPSSGVSEIENEIAQINEAIASRPPRDRRLKFLKAALKDAEMRWQEAKEAAGPQGVMPYAQVDSPEPLAAPTERTPDGRPMGVAPAPLVNPEPMKAEQAKQASAARGRRRAAAGVAPAPEAAAPAPAQAAAPAAPAVVAAAAASSKKQVSPSTAEPTEDIAAQISAMADPQTARDSVFVAEGNEASIPAKLPKGVRRIERPGTGVLLTTSADKATKFRTKSKLVDADIQKMLGYSENKADVVGAGTAPVVVEARTKTGAVEAQQIATPKNARAAAAAVKAQARKGSTVVTTTPEAAQADRTARAAKPAPAAPKNPVAAKAAEKKAARGAVKKKPAKSHATQRAELEAKGLDVATDDENSAAHSRKDTDDRTVQDEAKSRVKATGKGAAAPRLVLPRSAPGKPQVVTTKAGKHETLPGELTVESGSKGEVVDLTVTTVDEQARFFLEQLKAGPLSTVDAEKVDAQLLRLDQHDTMLDAAVDAAEDTLLERVSASPEGNALVDAAERAQLRVELDARRDARSAGRPHGRPKESPLTYVQLMIEEMLDFGRLVLQQAQAEVKAGTTEDTNSVARRLIPQLLPATELLMGQLQTQKAVIEMVSKLSPEYMDHLVRTAASRLQDSLLAKQVMRGASEVARVHTREEAEVVKEVKRKAAAKPLTDAQKPGPVIELQMQLEPADLDLKAVSHARVTTYVDDLPDAAGKTVNGWLELMERGGIAMTGEVRVVSWATAVKLYPKQFGRGAPSGRFASIKENGKTVHIIAVNWNAVANDAIAVEALAHEFGHYASMEVFNRSDRTTQTAILAAFRLWLQAHGKESPNNIFRSHAPGLLQGLTPAQELTFEYATDFREWSANHVARFLLTDAEAKSVVEKYFAKVAEILRKIYSKMMGTEKPNDAWREAMAVWISGAAAENAAPHFRMAGMGLPADMTGFADEGAPIEDAPGVRTARAVLNRTTAALGEAKAQMTSVAQLALNGNTEGLGEVADSVADKIMASNMGQYFRRFGLSLTTLDQLERKYRNSAGKFGEALSAWVRNQKRKAQLSRVAMFGGEFDGVTFVGAAGVLERANHLSVGVRTQLQEVMYYATHYGVHPDQPFDHASNAHLSKDVSDEAKVANERRYLHVRNLWDGLRRTDASALEVYAELRDAFTDLHEKTLELQITNLVALKNLKGSKPLSDEAIDEALKQIRDNARTLKHGPYFPLMRFGNWIVSVTQPSAATFHDTRAQADAAKKEAKDLHRGVRVEVKDEGDGKFSVRTYHKGVYFFDSEAEARAARPQIEADLAEEYDAAGVDIADVRKALAEGKLDADDATGDMLVTNPFEKKTFDERIGRADFSRFISEVRAAAEGRKLDPELARVMENLYIESMPEFSARKSMLPRQNVKGASGKMLQSYAMRYQGAANSYSSVKFGQGIQQSWSEMEANRDSISAGGAVLNNLHASQQAIADVTKDSLTNKIQNMITDASSLFSLAFSPAYILTNALQPFMITLPVLAGASWMKGNTSHTVGVVKAGQYIKDAYEGALPYFSKRGVADFVDESKRLFNAKSSGETLQSTQHELAERFGKTPEEQKMLTNLLESGRLDFSFLNSIEDAMRGDGIAKTFGNVARLGMALPQQVEAMNRVVTALAAFRIAKVEMGLPDAEAMEYASDVVGDTQLDYSRLNRPLAFNKQGWRVVLQFKLYMQGMYALFVRNAYMAMRGKSAAEKAQGRKTLLYLLGTHGAMGGAAGLGPIAFAAKGAVMLAALAMGDEDDDEWKSSEQMMSEHATFVFGDKGGQAVQRGLPALLGLDIADRIGLPVLADKRFTGIKETDDAGSQMDKWLLYTLGAPYSNIRRVVKAGGASVDGDPFTKVSDGLPAGARAMWRAGLAAKDGLVDRDGDTFMGPDQLSWKDVGVMATGFQPAKTARAYRERSEEKKTLAEIQSARTLLIKRWRTADPAERDTLRPEIAEFSAGVPKPFRIKGADLSRSVKAKRERDAGAVSKNEAAVKDYLR